MQNFLSRLEKGEHIPDDADAELITRFEMQKFCPDILITNYSMLEYMLMRPRERKIWTDTAAWKKKFGAIQNLGLTVIQKINCCL